MEYPGRANVAAYEGLPGNSRVHVLVDFGRTVVGPDTYMHVRHNAGVESPSTQRFFLLVAGAPPTFEPRQKTMRLGRQLVTPHFGFRVETVRTLGTDVCETVLANPAWGVTTWLLTAVGDAGAPPDALTATSVPFRATDAPEGWDSCAY